MKYEFSNSLQVLAEDICNRVFPYVKIDRIKCYRSYGSSTKRTIARCHALGKLMQVAMDVDAFYALEFLGEKFNSMSTEGKIKIVIHELMHIPESFGGGFKHHDIVTDRSVNNCYKLYLECRDNEKKVNWFELQRQKKKRRG